MSSRILLLILTHEDSQILLSWAYVSHNREIVLARVIPEGNVFGRAVFTIQNVDGIPPNLWELPDATSNVAVQYATAMAFPTPLFVFRIERTVEAFTQLFHSLLGMQPVPGTVGISFNYFLEHDLLEADAIYMCHMFKQFAGRGASVLVASGNNGVGAGNCRMFHVEFPSSCTCDVCYSFQSPHKCVAHQSIIFAGP